MGLFKLLWCHWAETRLLSLFRPQRQLPSSWPFRSNREPGHWNTGTPNRMVLDCSFSEMCEWFGKKQSWAGNSFQIFLSFLCIYLCIYLSSIHPLVCIHIHTHGYIFSFSHSVMSNSLHPHGLQPTRFLSAWNSPGKHIGVDSHSLLQRIFLTQGLNPGLHCTGGFFTIWATRGAMHMCTYIMLKE